VGESVPAYHATALSGGSFRLSDLRGQVVLLNVWATWCPPCREEMPALERLHDELGERGVRVVGVSIDKGESADVPTEFLRENGITFTILRDASGQVARTFQTRGVPETFLIGRDGTLLQRWVGRIEPGSASVRGAVERALATSVSR